MEHFITKKNSIKTLKPENMRKKWNQFSLTNFLAISGIRRKQKKTKTSSTGKTFGSQKAET